MNTYIFIFIWIACGICIYFDAKKRNLKAASSWAILGAVLGILGVIGYLQMIVKPNRRNN
jgi:hypothetical protein